MTAKRSVADDVLGRFGRQYHDWFERVRNGSLDPEEVMRVVQKLIDGGLQNIFSLTINYSLPLAEAIAKGKYDWVNSDITADHFPNAGVDTVELEARLCHFNKVMEFDDVLKELDQAGLRPATLRELLAFGEQHSDIQKQFPIIALGSVWQGRGGGRGVPGLWSSAHERNLGLGWFDLRWDEDFRFLAVRK